MKILSFCIILVILRKLSVIKYAKFSSKNVLRTYLYHLKLLEAFIFEVSQRQSFSSLKQKFTRNARTRQNIDFLRSILTIF